MLKAKNHTDEKILDQIYLIRGQKVMIDADLAILYGVETKRLKEAVRRNASRFPEDFMFKLNREELKKLRTQNASFNLLKYSPFCFTEQGVTMLSCILNSDRAIEMNIRIIRLFTRLRETLSQNTEILKRVEAIEKRIIDHDKDLQLIFEALKQLLRPGSNERSEIGYVKRRGTE